MTGYRQIAADLRADIDTGRYPPGAVLPTVRELAAERATSTHVAHAALRLLEAQGYAQATRGHPSRVLDRRAVRVELSRYSAVLAPGGELGPWETACQRAGVPGRMVLLEVEHSAPDPDVAAGLGITRVQRVVRRSRHAVLGDPEQVVQIQTAWYPARLVRNTPIAEDSKVTGGVYAALTAAGITPATADETVTIRTATADEAAELHMRGGAVLYLERITRDSDGRALEFLQVVADPARTVLVYDSLPLQ